MIPQIRRNMDLAYLLDRLIYLAGRVLLAKKAGMAKELTHAERLYAQHVAEMDDYLREERK